MTSSNHDDGYCVGRHAAFSEVTVGIKTFMRPHALERCLRSLIGFGFHEVIVADDSLEPARTHNLELVSQFEYELPINPLELENDVGLAAGRNAIVDACGTRLLLVLDDDHVVNHSLGSMLCVLEDDRSLGGVSAIWLEDNRAICTACNLFYNKGYLIKEFRSLPSVRHSECGRPYIMCDFVPNSTLFRMNALREVRWDPTFKIGREHEDFYVRHMMLGRWAFAVSLDTHIHHLPEIGVGDYGKFRRGRRLKASKSMFKSKFGVRGVVEGRKWIGGQESFSQLYSRGVHPLIASCVARGIRRSGRYLRHADSLISKRRLS